MGTTTAPTATTDEIDLTDGPVVVGVDQTDTATKAAQRAVELAEQLGVDVHVVTAVEYSAPTVIRIGSDEFVIDQHTDDRTHLAALKQTLGYSRITTGLAGAPVGKNLAEEAERVGAQVIVVGNRRVKGAARFLGSVAGDVLRHAHCDVLVVNTTGN